MFCFPNTGYADDTLGNRFFQISSYQHAYLRIIYEKTMSQVPLGLLGKQNIQAKEVYYAEMDIDLVNHYLVVPQERVREDLG